MEVLEAKNWLVWFFSQVFQVMPIRTKWRWKHSIYIGTLCSGTASRLQRSFPAPSLSSGCTEYAVGGIDIPLGWVWPCASHFCLRTGARCFWKTVLRTRSLFHMSRGTRLLKFQVLMINCFFRAVWPPDRGTIWTLMSIIVMATSYDMTKTSNATASHCQDSQRTRRPPSKFGRFWPTRTRLRHVSDIWGAIWDRFPSIRGQYRRLDFSLENHDVDHNNPDFIYSHLCQWSFVRSHKVGSHMSQQASRSRWGQHIRPGWGSVTRDTIAFGRDSTSKLHFLPSEGGQWSSFKLLITLLIIISYVKLA